ncbi:hypothetical protein AHF37_05849 [Paragonimus kellicotti]|nr:hypothetical protein AHF37_05849 [Paragonimus kellicotti]
MNKLTFPDDAPKSVNETAYSAKQTLEKSQSKAVVEVEENDDLLFEQSEMNKLTFPDDAPKSVNETAYSAKQTLEKKDPDNISFTSIPSIGSSKFSQYTFTKILTVTDPKEKQARINKISTIMGAVGCAQLLIGVGQGYFFGVSGQRLIKRMRSRLFDAILHQEIGWFDRPENQAGALTAMLSTEASKVSQFTGTRLGSVLEAILIVAISLGVAFAYSWQITLVILAFIPFLAVSSLLQVT